MGHTAAWLLWDDHTPEMVVDAEHGPELSLAAHTSTAPLCANWGRGLDLGDVGIWDSHLVCLQDHE